MNKASQPESVSRALIGLLEPLILHEFGPLPEVEDTPHGKALVAAVYRAIDSLEGQGARSCRVAAQLLLALARYECELQCAALRILTPPTAQGPVEAEKETPTYRIDWCKWEHGGGDDMQEWKPSDETYDDEYVARERVKDLDNRFAPHFRHRYVEMVGK